MRAHVVIGCATVFVRLATAQEHAHEPAAGGNPFNSSFQRILNESKAGFRSLKAARNENRRREYFYESNVYLPAATYCRILDQQAIVFTCEWSRPSGGGSLSAFYEQLVAKIESKLGPEWQKQAARDRLRNEVVFSGPDKPTVGVIQRAQPVTVHLFVMPPGDSTTGIWDKLRSLDDFFHPSIGSTKEY